MKNLTQINNVLKLKSLPTDPTVSGVDKGLIYFNTTLNAFRVYDGTGWSTLEAGTSSTVAWSDITGDPNTNIDLKALLDAKSPNLNDEASPDPLDGHHSIIQTSILGKVKYLKAGTNVTITSDTNSITISSSGSAPVDPVFTQAIINDTTEQLTDFVMDFNDSSVILTYTITRLSTTENYEYVKTGTIYFNRKGTGIEITGGSFGGDYEVDVTFSINSANGQVSYTSGNLLDQTFGQIKYKLIRL